MDQPTFDTVVRHINHEYKGWWFWQLVILKIYTKTLNSFSNSVKKLFLNQRIFKSEKSVKNQPLNL
jgi:hypothetical protein